MPEDKKNKVKYIKNGFLSLLEKEPVIDEENEQSELEYGKWCEEVLDVLHPLLDIHDMSQRLSDIFMKVSDIEDTLREHKHLNGKVVEEI